MADNIDDRREGVPIYKGEIGYLNTPSGKLVPYDPDPVFQKKWSEFVREAAKHAGDGARANLTGHRSNNEGPSFR